MIRCEICNRLLRSITNTHLQLHGITEKEYLIKYPNSKLRSKETLKKLSKGLKGKNLGKKRPDAKIRMLGKNNPMKSNISKSKMSKTRKKNIANGKIDIKSTLKNINNLPTGYERKAIKLFKELNIPLDYVGDGSFNIGGKIPDFINKDLKLAIELDIKIKPSNHHLKELDHRRKLFLKEGWLMVVFRNPTKEEILKYIKPFFTNIIWSKIKEIKTVEHPYPGQRLVYNLECEPHNNYIANGVIVHNCFSDAFKSNNPALRDVDFLQGVDVERLYRAMIGEGTDGWSKAFYNHFYSRRFLLHWGGLADPFCYYEKKHGVGRRIVEMLGDLKYPTLFSFKGPTILTDKYLQLFDKFKKNKNFAFQVSIVAATDELSKKIEPGTPTTSQRLEALKTLSDMGYWTILRLRPFIIGITDQNLDVLLQNALEAGIDGVSTEFFAIDSRVNKSMVRRYAKISKLTGVEDIFRYHHKLSPSERGGYLRLNRLIKEQYIKQIYKFCLDNDVLFACSDPDFKELCMSGSCCGMPDHYPDNPELENWTKNQLTEHLKEARRKYHKTGKLHKFFFDEVYGEESYLEDNELADENIGCVSRIYAQRVVVTLRHFLLDKWNNLKSPSNPRNYLHGKILPCGLDDNGNLIYKYNPMPYEKRWKDEGIDLTR